MLKFKVQIKHQLIEFEVSKDNTIADLKRLIAQQENISNFDLFIFSKKLPDDVSAGKILYNCVTDCLEVREQIQVQKLKSFFNNAIPLLRQKTIESTAKFQKKLFQDQECKISKMLSFFTKAPQLVKQKTSNQFSTFLDQVKGQVTMSHIHQIEEDQPKNLNNDTVLNILDDMKNKEKVKKPQVQQKSLSPKQEQYLQRKKKALELLEDPKQKEKARLLIQELKKQKQLLKQKILETHNQSAELRDQSIEKYKAERDQMMQRIAQEKKNKILERLQENQQYHQKQLQMHKQSKHLILELKTRMKKVQDMAKQKDDQLKQIYYEEAKVKLQERKKASKSIRLQELNAHEDQYLENKELHRIQRDQKKLEQEIKIRAETKSVYRDEKILKDIIKIDQEIKNKDIQEQKKRELYRIRKQKYSEIIYEFHKPTQMSKIEEPKISIDNAKLKRDASYSQHQSKNRSLIELLAKKGLRDTNIKKIEAAISQQHIQPKTQITESLQQGKVPDVSTYFHMRVHTPTRMSIPEESSSIKKKDYLREFERNRKSTHQIKGPEQQLRFLQKLESDAKKKEQLALVCGDDDLQVEATELYLQSVKAKLSFLDNKLSNF